MIKKRIVLLSPHPDDIAFSIGGTICSDSFKNASFLLMNIFNKSQYCLPTFKTDCINQQREQEDKKFAEDFSLIIHNLDLPDSSVLGHTAYSETICAPNDMRSITLKQKLTNILNREKPDIVFCPLGIGGHIDHKMIKEICIDTYHENDWDLIFYEDLPYAYYYSSVGIESIVRKTISLKNLCAQYINITDIWDVKERGIKYYESQVNQTITSNIKIYAQSLGLGTTLLERIWVTKRADSLLTL